MTFVSGDYCCLEGPFVVGFPGRPPAVPASGSGGTTTWPATVSNVDIVNPVLGRILGYHPTFADRTVPMPSRADIPREVLPRRQTASTLAALLTVVRWRAVACHFGAS